MNLLRCRSTKKIVTESLCMAIVTKSTVYPSGKTDAKTGINGRNPVLQE